MEKKYIYKAFGVGFIILAVLSVVLISILSVKNYNDSKWSEKLLTELGVKEPDMTIAIALVEDFMADNGLTKEMYGGLPGFTVDYFPDKNNYVDDGFGLMFCYTDDDLNINYYSSFYVRTYDAENSFSLG